MSEVLDNAVTSIQIGIEDYKSNDPKRQISAIRNFYAGVLLLGKECLLNEAPEANTMDVLASNFVPVPNDEGGVDIKPQGSKTIDLSELKQRFKLFGLQWPTGDVQALQKIRNDLEHLHSKAPKETMRQTIAGCFPLVEGFCNILAVNPVDLLQEAWETMLQEEAFFSKQKAECNATFGELFWCKSISNWNSIECSSCGSSLIYQTDPLNKDPQSIDGRCKACAENFSAEETVTLILDAEFGTEDYISIKDGAEPVIHDCPECGSSAYVASGEVNFCFLCEYSVEGECGRCMTPLGVMNIAWDNHKFCSYCDDVMSKDD